MSQFTEPCDVTLMVAGRRTHPFTPNESSAFSPNQALNQNQAVNYRKLGKRHLGGVIFGCKSSTIKECLFKQLFGLPAQHFCYVKNIEPGMPLFLFNYTDRKLHGIFEAASPGQMNLNPYAWTTDGSERTVFPAQVQIRLGLRCHPLSEEQFKPIISDIYYTTNHFWFELDHAQASKLSSLLSSMAIAPSTFAPQNSTKWRALFQAPPSHDRVKEIEEPFKPRAFEAGWCLDGAPLDANNHALEDSFEKQVVEKPEDLIYMKLKELVLNRERSNPPLSDIQDSAAVNELHSGQEGLSDAQTNSEGISEESLINSLEYPSVVAQLVQGMQELKVFKREQIHKMCRLEQKLVEAETEIKQLKQRGVVLESRLHPSVAHVEEMAVEPFNDLDLDLDELIFLVGGYDGASWLSALDSYSPSHDVIKSLKPMNCIRSYSSVARLNGELYVFGGGNGSLWYDSVESYDPASDHWTLRPSLNVQKGSLGGATLNNKIFAIGGGNGVESFADVEMLDLDVGRWIGTRSMLQKRFALAVAELNGALYAVGGYDGKDYLESAERFDPREHSWIKIANMNTKRGCHSMAVLNEKLYAIGGYDGSEMVPSVEIFDPRLGSWMIGEPMDQSRGYSCAAVLKDSLYVIGGVKPGSGEKHETIVDTVERYKEGQGWEVTNLRAIGERCFFSAIVLGG
ncbi:uncharacterized protein LOC131300782 isoform X2 [Rhododendron vialii]|uniref:uncharacterized protein LOC131300782 isoform X2 n=1 Tax=Rhododendron vialii TaxID=182163 RepID=UPI00265E431A|nr:uncharacterized protein LOC131300782 isoform X2 [Rhododendron vialii]